jgi:hypothetical protein
LTADEFDAVCAYLCISHDNEKEAKRLEIQLNSICAMLGGKPKTSGDSEDDDLEAY